MNWFRFLRTSAGRTALRHSLVFSAFVGLCIGLTMLAQMRWIDNDVAQLVHSEAKRLELVHGTQSHQEFLQEISTLGSQSLESERLYVLERAGERTPEKLSSLQSEDGIFNIWVDSRDIPGLPRDESGYWPGTILEFDDGCRLLLSVHSELNEALRHQLLPSFVVLGVLLVILMLWLGASIGRSMLVKVDVLNSTARAVTAGELSRRAPLDGSGDEFDELSLHFNTMLDKTEKLLLGMRRVSDNVAHDLRKPLSSLRSGLEVTLLESRDPQQYRQAMENAVREAERVIATFNSLLQIARVESGAGPRERACLDLGSLVTDLADLYSDMGSEIVVPEGSDVLMMGEPHLLRQAVSNLLENSLKFAPGLPITLSARKEGRRALVIVEDRGPGIPEGKRGFVLERFARLEEARSTPGNGLGLAMVKATVELHRGAILLEDANPGLRVTLSFRCEGL